MNSASVDTEVPRLLGQEYDLHKGDTRRSTISSIMRASFPEKDLLYPTWGETRNTLPTHPLTFSPSSFTTNVRTRDFSFSDVKKGLQRGTRNTFEPLQ